MRLAGIPWTNIAAPGGQIIYLPPRSAHSPATSGLDRRDCNKDAGTRLPLPSTVFDLKNTMYYDLEGKDMYVPQVQYSRNKNIRNARVATLLDMRAREAVERSRHRGRT